MRRDRDGIAPFSGNSVRPPWLKSDARWRWRVLVGIWILVFVPFLDVLQAMRLASKIPVPDFFDVSHSRLMLEDTLLCEFDIYQSILICVGVALILFREKGRRHSRLDWTRQWGVICCYMTFIIAAVSVLFVTALVAVGIGRLFLSMPAKEQPRFAGWFIEISASYLRSGPQPGEIADMTCVVSSAVAVLLACVPLFNALRSSGPKRLAAILVAPLAAFSLYYVALVGLLCVGFTTVNEQDISQYSYYFSSDLMVSGIWDFNVRGYYFGPPSQKAVYVEFAKWLIVLIIAMWLTMAQLGFFQRKPKREVLDIGQPRNEK